MRRVVMSGINTVTREIVVVSRLFDDEHFSLDTAFYAPAAIEREVIKSMPKTCAACTREEFTEIIEEVAVIIATTGIQVNVSGVRKSVVDFIVTESRQRLTEARKRAARATESSMLVRAPAQPAKRWDEWG